MSFVILALRSMKKSIIFLFFILCVSYAYKAQTTFDERGRISLGAGGNLAFQNFGGYNMRSYLQFSPKWKIVVSAADLFRFNALTQKITNEWHYDLNVLHARKDYNQNDVFYLFEGINIDQWNRSSKPKMPFREVIVKSTPGDTVRLVGALNFGLGIEKNFGLLGLYAELKIGIGATDWLMVYFGLKTNFGRIFNDPKKRYDLNLEEVE